MFNRISIVLLAAAVIPFLAGGCATYFKPLETHPATLGQRTPMYQNLVSLPEPMEKIVVAVYKFRDQTGQYKASSSGSTFSTAVTQGATSILTRALEESGWFLPIEREGLSNLLNERKIIRSSRAEYVQMSEDGEQPAGPLLPPLLFAGVLIEGGIISYETNNLTGGSGLKYFGVGGSGEYRQDRVTIYLRAISTQNGRVLKTVHTSKTILSQRVNAGLFRYVNFQRLLEAETGYSYNEPPELCVTEAIEKAVESLIIEGVFDNLWQLKNPGDIDYNPVIRQYQADKAITQRTDPFGHELHARPKFAVGLSGGGNRYNGDYSFERWEGDYSVSLLAMLHEDAAVRLDAGLFKAATRTRFSADGMYGQLGLEYRPLSALRFSPYLLGGAGAMNITTTLFHHQSNGEVTDLYPYVFAGAGLEVLLVDGFALDLGVTGRYLLDDMMDGANHGEWNDYFWTGRMGLLVFLPI